MSRCRAVVVDVRRGVVFLAVSSCLFCARCRSSFKNEAILLMVVLLMIIFILFDRECEVVEEREIFLLGFFSQSLHIVVSFILFISAASHSHLSGRLLYLFKILRLWLRCIHNTITVNARQHCCGYVCW